jgi:sugar/nucleoside kinase (ribokinase family)
MANQSSTGEVVVIGELNVDGVATGLSAPPKMGSEVLASGFQLALGSASAIFACGVAKLGGRVMFISRVGRDDFGDFCLAALKEAGVSTTLVTRAPGVGTGITLSLSTRRDRALVTYPGAMATLTYEQVDMSALEGKSHLHMTSYFLQAGLRPSFARIFRKARRAGLTTSFDPNSDPAHSWGRGIWKVLEQTDVLFVNAREAAELTGTQDTRAALKIFNGHVPCAVIKQGSKGAVAVKDGKFFRSPGFRVNALDTTGAGDSFDAGFVSAFLRGETVDACLSAGNACGAMSTLEAGGTAGQPGGAQLKTFLREHPR